MLRRQLYRIFVTILLIPAIIIGSYMLFYNYDLIYDHHIDMLKSDNIRIRSILYDVTTSIANISETITRDQEFQSLFRTEYAQSHLALRALDNMALLDEIYARYPEISTVTVYTDNASLVNYDNIVVIDKAQKTWFDELIRNQVDKWGTRTYTDKYNNLYKELQVTHPIIIANSDYNAVLVISISGNYLKNRIDNNTLDVDIAVNHEPIFFSTMGNENQTISLGLSDAASYYSFSGVDTYNEREVMIESSFIRPVLTSDFIYIFSVDDTAVHRLQGLLWTEILIIAMSIFVPTIIIIVYTRQLTFRVTTLRTEMRRVTSGDYNIIDNFKGSDELSDLFNDLKVMIKSIKERDQLIYEGHLEEQRLVNQQKSIEFQLLSSKINPHFLYNTLETIRMKAFNSGNLEVATAAKLLGKFMRYNLESSSELKPLANELEYIKTYLEIQTLRFGDRIQYAIEIDASLNTKHLLILPLLIQPLVENALLHGHDETTEGGQIWIRCIDNDHLVRIEIEDNGKGMTESELEKVLEKISLSLESDKTSFGLHNIQHRLLLLYGEDAMLTFETEEGKGTCIGFSIPKSRMEGN